MTPFEELVLVELERLQRAGVPTRGVRITVRDLVVARMERVPADADEIGAAVEATIRAACRVAREVHGADELVETVCYASLDAVRGHGGETARWLAHAMARARAVLEQVAADRAGDAEWPWRPLRLDRW